ncbi:hypothetical protein GCM10023238_15110 [Streptomyces heliomycini]
MLDDGQADQGDHHGEAGEDHGGARGADGPAGRFLAPAALGQFGGSGDDEQRVVRCRREADIEARMEVVEPRSRVLASAVMLATPMPTR